MKILVQLFLALAISCQAAATENKGASTQKTGHKNPPAGLLRSASTIIYSDDFNGANDTASLHQRGYITVYNGTGAQNGPTWQQGEPIWFGAYNGPDDGYVAADFNVVADSNRIDSWLILPEMALNSGDSLSFYCRSKFESLYRDSVKVMFSASGNPDVNSPDWTELGFFKTDTLGIWRRKAFTAPAGGATARFAIRYFLNSGGPLGTSSEYVGIDQITVATGVVGRQEELEAARISVYPNPATTQITVLVENEGESMLIYNAIGKEVIMRKVTSGTNSINIQHLPDGLYTVKIISADTIRTGRFIKR